MHGNVWEWTLNCYSSSYYDVVVSYVDTSVDSDDPRCKRAMIRGGSWDTNGTQMRVWNRVEQRKSTSSSDIGIRLVREIPDERAK